MKKTIINLLFVFIAYTSFSQMGKIKPDEFKILQSGTMVVLLNGTEEHNEMLKKSIEQEWKHTPYIFATEEEKDQYIGNNKYFFLMLGDTYQKVGTEPRFATILSIIENRDGATRLEEERWKSFYVFIQHEENTYYVHDVPYIHKIPDFVRNLSWQWEYTMKNEGKMSLIDPFKMIDAAHEDLSGKTLLIEKDIVSNELINEEKFSKYYPYKYKFVEKDEVAEAINNKDNSKAYLYYAMDDKVGVAVTIWEAGTGRCLAFKQFSTGALNVSNGSYGSANTAGRLKGVLWDKIGTKELKKVAN